MNSFHRGIMALHVDTPIQYLKGVGPKLGALLRKKGVETLKDLLHNYPRAYEDRRAARNIASLKADEIVSIQAEVLRVSSYNLGRSRKKAYDVTVRDGSGVIHCKFFRVPYKGYFERFQPRQSVRVIGKVTHYRGQVEFHHPDIQEVNQQEEVKDELVPIYSETDGLSTTRWRKIVSQATQAVERGEVQGVEEALPKWILDKYQLPNYSETIQYLHAPPEGAGEEYLHLRSPYHRRVIFEEFFWLELLLAAKRQGVRRDKAPLMAARFDLCEKLKANLPFSLTQAQLKAFQEISDDMQAVHPMHRLVQGDVGSGKTLVALLASLLSIENQYQVALMVPTEILAKQHYKGALKLLEPLGVRVGFVSGHLKAKEKQEVLEATARGEIQLLVGTHALIQDQVEFHKLGLVIVDEQHRFGVEQRKKLKGKGPSPHLLLMTATPIPRSLAMTVYGDLDVSIIDEMPAGRKPIQTRVTYQSKRGQILQFITEQIEKGRQAYIVFPLVDESEKIELSSAVQEFEKLSKELPQFKMGLVHGKMKSEQKDEVMLAFYQGEYQILVATTVIEVGVDVPNANIIWIDHAERFGLSQLHQLRGRVGRGEHKSFCILSLGYAVSQESKARIDMMETCQNGFQISEADLEIRGPGEFLGSRQSGLPGFRMANLVRDIDILKLAREAAFAVIAQDPQLQRKSNQALRHRIWSTDRDLIG
jgi:ATP-dependent DNA helicase RecG